MKRISAEYIFTGKKILKRGIIELNSNGEITKVTDTGGKISEQQSLEFYNGVIVPGFVNAHCHLELSHMKGMIKNTTVKGLPGFIDEIISKRNFPDNLQDYIEKADKEMQMKGIVAVGDISNTDDSFTIKKNSSIYYQTFIEAFTVSNEKVIETFEQAANNYYKLKKLNLSGTIVPHAAYTVPHNLYEMISKYKNETSKIISVHNQETPGEDELIKNKTGTLAEVLIKKGFQLKDFSYPGNSALETNLYYLNKKDNILLIHNTFSKEKDIETAENFSDNIYWVFCPLSNLYIEKTLPNLPVFFKKNVKTCIGTDSYASNTELSILSEMKVIIENYPEIPFEQLIKSATINGAKALKIQNKYGSIETGKTPGLNLITKFDFEKMTLKPESSVKVLVS
ncbi:MAG: amidohydrolase family protein [Bacteroidales bacterium]|nr:amidohydrolase family protein [Bacteroidales bacterium]